MTTKIVFGKPAYRPDEVIDLSVATDEPMTDTLAVGGATTRAGRSLPATVVTTVTGMYALPGAPGYHVAPAPAGAPSYLATPDGTASAASATFTGALVTSAGAVVSYGGMVAITRPATAALVHGVTPDTLSGAAAFDAHVKSWPDSHISRAYGQVGQGLPAWDRYDVAPHVAAGREIWFSAKDLDVPGSIAHMKAAPPGTGPIWYTFRHEANRPKTSTGAVYVTAAELLAFGHALGAEVEKLPAALRDRIRLVVNFSWFPAVHGNEGVKWRDFVPAGHPWDAVSWDQYNDSSTHLHDPADFAALPIASGHETGLPVLIGEWGVQPGTYTDAAAASWCTAVAGAWAGSGVVVRACYWCSHAGTNPSYHTDGRPAVAAAVHALM